MERKKLTATLLTALFLVSIAIAVPIEPATASPLLVTPFIVERNLATGSWIGFTTEQTVDGLYSVKMHLPGTEAGRYDQGLKVGIESPYADLASIDANTLSFKVYGDLWMKDSLVHSPYITIIVDLGINTEHGRLVSMIPASPGGWGPRMSVSGTGWMTATPAYPDEWIGWFADGTELGEFLGLGHVTQSLSAWDSALQTAGYTNYQALHICIQYGFDPEMPEMTAYIDDLTVNGETYDFEPTNEVWVDDDWTTTSPWAEAGQWHGGEAVDGHVFGRDAFATIQDAIDAVAEGGTVHVAAGVYEEQLIINKSLTLEGAGYDTTTIKSPASLTKTAWTHNGRSFYTLIEVNGATAHVITVDINGFIIDGNYNFDVGEPGEKKAFTGIVYRNADGSIRNNEIKNFRDEPLSAFQYGEGIWVVPSSNVIITNNNIHDYQKTGIRVDGDGAIATVTGNVVTGYGANDLIAQNGILFYGGATGTVSDNIVTNHIYTPEEYDACGVLIFGTGSEIKVYDNTVDSNDIGIAIYWTAGVKVSGNNIINNKIGIEIYSDVAADVESIKVNYNNIVGNALLGVNNLGVGTLNAILNWWSDSSGPHHPTLNPDGLGDKVSDNVDFDPWLTAPITVVSSKAGTDEWLEFPESDVEVYVSGSATVYIATYESNPGASFMGDIGNYIDVYIPDTSGLTELEIRKYYTNKEIEALGLTESSLRIYWWNGTDWLPCSETGVNTAENYIWAIVNATTTPSLTDLTGTPFGAAGRVPVGGVILPVDKLSIITPWLLIAAIIASGTIIILRKTRP